VTFSLKNVTGATVTPFLTNEKYSMSQRPGLAISKQSFSYTVPARSLVTFLIAGPKLTSSPAVYHSLLTLPSGHRVAVGLSTGMAQWTTSVNSTQPWRSQSAVDNSFRTLRRRTATTAIKV
jgi:hypothetical protein